MRLATVKISKPSLVTNYLAQRGRDNPDNKVVIVDIEEDGIFDLPVLHGLPFNIQVQPGWRVWVIKSQGGDRWVMIGIYDDNSVIADTDMIKMQLPDGDALIQVGNNKIKYLDATQKISINDNLDTQV